MSLNLVVTVTSLNLVVTETSLNLVVTETSLNLVVTEKLLFSLFIKIINIILINGLKYTNYVRIKVRYKKMS
jgi:hypothetical protein